MRWATRATASWHEGVRRSIVSCMTDDLYERDILAWSEHQAELLRRLGRGEQVNDVDWANLAEAPKTWVGLNCTPSKAF